MKSLDETDRAIIAQLQYDGRKSYTDIAAELGVSEASIRRRVKSLTDEGALQVVGIVPPQFLDLSAAAMIGVRIEAGKIESAAATICDFPEVVYVFMSTGGFDLFIEVYCRDREHLVHFLNDKLQAVPGVIQTDTFMILKMYKLSYRWGEVEASHTINRPVSGGYQE